MGAGAGSVRGAGARSVRGAGSVVVVVLEA